MSSNDPPIPDYLRPDFDPSKATVSQLTSFLSEAGVDVPATKQKKEFYVEKFQTEVTPKRDRMVKDLQKVAKSVNKAKPPKGISIVDRFQNAAAEDEGGSSGANVTPRKRKSVKGKPEVIDLEAEFEEEVPLVRPDRKGKGKSSGEDTTPTGTDGVESVFSDDNVFSDENPFQTPAKEALRVKKKRKSVLPGSEAADAGEDEEVNPALSLPKTAKPKTTGRAKRSVQMETIRPKANVASPQPFMFRAGEADLNFTGRGAQTPTFGQEGDEEVIAPIQKTPARRKSSGDALLGSTAKSKLAPRRSVMPTIRAASSSSDAQPEDSGGNDSEEPQRNAPSPERYLNLDNISPPPSPPPEKNPSPKTRQTAEWQSLTPSTQTPTRKPASTIPTVRVEQPKRKNQQKKQEPDWLLILGTIVFLLSAALTHWYWEQKDLIGYCDANDTARLNFQYKGYNPLGYVLPICKQCPDRSVCVGKTVLSCDNAEYVLKPHWIAKIVPQKFLPFPVGESSCVENMERVVNEVKRQRQVDALIGMTEEITRKWVGKVECGELKTAKGAGVRGGVGSNDTVPEWVWSEGRVLGMPLASAKKELRDVIGRKWDDKRFAEFWGLVVQKLVHPEESDGAVGGGSRKSDLTTVLDKSHMHRLLSSSRPPIMSFACRMRKGLWETLQAYWIQLLGVGLAVVVGIFVMHKRGVAMREARIVAELVEDALDAVHEETDAHYRDQGAYPVPGLSVSQLRDHLLPVVVPGRKKAKQQQQKNGGSVTGKAEWSDGVEIARDEVGRTIWYLADEGTRKKIWERVEGLVLRNSNVRETGMELKGEMHRVWGWVGGAALSPRKQRGGRRFNLEVGSGSEVDSGVDSGTEASGIRRRVVGRE
ncbi:inner nuclear membrane protein enriched at telomere/subtelomere region [Rhizophlyctis rosea]|uniref:Inner nuclear membrane protein enriched at telomere/subtelomere region n=1 Tax=Rhizophlyctis rosea TaxID=64517 RepID=A0AAD5WYU4_9FUNG|nr:inner nuclear membrane protein enriched at telomere/subtelomere region [Rhizophlyctis rosea]